MFGHFSNKSLKTFIGIGKLLLSQLVKRTDLLARIMLNLFMGCTSYFLGINLRLLHLPDIFCSLWYGPKLDFLILYSFITPRYLTFSFQDIVTNRNHPQLNSTKDNKRRSKLGKI